MSAPIVFLVDNGSLRPQATLILRSLADALAERTVLSVEAVSLLHSHKIAADKLNGVSATIVKRRLRECLAAGQREFIFLCQLLSYLVKAVKREFDLLVSAQDEGPVDQDSRQQELKQFEPSARDIRPTIHRRLVAGNR